MIKESPDRTASRTRSRTATSRRPARPTRKDFAPNRSVLGRYFSDIRCSPALTREEEAKLARQIQAGCRNALNRLVESNLKFVVKIAKEYRNLGVPFEDLVNEGNLGMITAAQRYAPDRGTRFITWAAWWIRKSIRDALAYQPQIVRLPTSQLNRMRVVRDTERALQEDIGREPTREELAAQLPGHLAGLDPIHRHGIRYISLDHRANSEPSDQPPEWLADTSLSSVEHDMLEREATENVLALFEQLNDQQRTVLACRLGLNGERPMTLRETGKRIGRSGECARLIEDKAIERLRKMLVARTARFHRRTVRVA